MKTLRLLRNLAALFILAAALLVPRSSAAAGTGNTCLFSSSTIGWNCVLNSNGTCSGAKCTPGRPCSNSQCVTWPSQCFHPPCIGNF
jgi:hypothetical protein